MIFVSYPPGGSGHKLGRIIGTSKKFLYPLVIDITKEGRKLYDNPIYGAYQKKISWVFKAKCFGVGPRTTRPGQPGPQKSRSRPPLVGTQKNTK